MAQSLVTSACRSLERLSIHISDHYFHWQEFERKKEFVCLYDAIETTTISHDHSKLCKIRDQYTKNSFLERLSYLSPSPSAEHLANAKRQDWDNALQELDVATRHCRDVYSDILKLVEAKSVSVSQLWLFCRQNRRNVLISTKPIIPTLSQALLFKFNRFFRPGYVFSSSLKGITFFCAHHATIGRLDCCKHIEKAFGKCQYIVLGNDADWIPQCLRMDWVYIPIDSPPDAAPLIEKFLT